MRGFDLQGQNCETLSPQGQGALGKIAIYHDQGAGNLVGGTGAGQTQWEVLLLSAGIESHQEAIVALGAGVSEGTAMPGGVDHGEVGPRSQGLVPTPQGGHLPDEGQE